MDYGRGVFCGLASGVGGWGMRRDMMLAVGCPLVRPKKRSKQINLVWHLQEKVECFQNSYALVKMLR